MQNTNAGQRTQPCDRMATYIAEHGGRTIQVPVTQGTRVAPTVTKNGMRYTLIMTTHYVLPMGEPITDETGRPISDDEALERIRLADAAGELTDLVRDALEDAA